MLPLCCPEGADQLFGDWGGALFAPHEGLKMKVALTDRKLKALKPAPAGQRRDLMDSMIPGFGIRVTDRGAKTFMLLTRYPGSDNPTRRALGEFPSLTLHEAREKAIQWRKQIKQGVDPSHQEAHQRRAEARRRANTFRSVAEDFITKKLPSERKGREVERDIRRDLMPAFGDTPVTEITRLEIRDVIEAKKKTAATQARNLLTTAKRLFTWAVDQERYGLDASPADSIKPKSVFNEEKAVGDRILSDDELFALWRAALHTAYPYGPLYQILVLSAIRLNEVADASWPEFDIPKRIWTIPAERMKGKNGKARPHIVPLTDDMIAILGAVPRFKTGPYLFTTTFGEKPVYVSDKAKKRIDARMLRTLRALARRRGEDPASAELPHWTNHDIRRTVRSNLSALRVPPEVAEAVLSHTLTGIIKVYDRHTYLDEKRDALERWAARLREIMLPAPPNVVRLRA